MNCCELLERRYPRTATREALAQAAQDGFDTTKIWFHGSRRRFDQFVLPKQPGIDELGPGVYLTSEKWLANTWARDGGVIAICLVRQGPVFDLATVNDSGVQKMLRDVFVTTALDSWFGDKPADVHQWLDEQFDERKRDKRVINKCLADAGYVGAINQASQIAGQIVVFKPADVRIIARQGGRAYMTAND